MRNGECASARPGVSSRSSESADAAPCRRDRRTVRSTKPSSWWHLFDRPLAAPFVRRPAFTRLFLQLRLSEAGRLKPVLQACTAVLRALTSERRTLAQFLAPRLEDPCRNTRRTM